MVNFYKANAYKLRLPATQSCLQQLCLVDRQYIYLPHAVFVFSVLWNILQLIRCEWLSELIKLNCEPFPTFLQTLSTD